MKSDLPIKSINWPCHYNHRGPSLIFFTPLYSVITGPRKGNQDRRALAAKNAQNWDVLFFGCRWPCISGTNQWNCDLRETLIRVSSMRGALSFDPSSFSFIIIDGDACAKNQAYYFVFFGTEIIPLSCEFRALLAVATNERASTQSVHVIKCHGPVKLKSRQKFNRLVRLEAP